MASNGQEKPSSAATGDTGPAAANSPVAVLPAREPLHIPDHELLRRIGAGSYGEVWLARNVLGQHRAVKVVYRASFEQDKPYEREFAGIRKFEPISRAHEGHVDILHVGRNDAAGYFYYVMELADDAHSSTSVAADVRRLTSGGARLSPPAAASDGQSASEDSKRLLHGDGAAAGDSRVLERGSPDPQRVRMEIGLGETTRAQCFQAATAGDSRAPKSEPPHVGCYEPRTLKSEIKRRGPLRVDDCVSIGLALTRALAHLHKCKLVHRDIKPSNIIFVGGAPKLADIGLVTGIDATRSFVGTDGYIPPEGPGTPQADLFSLGKVLYEMSTGQDRQDFPELPAAWRTSAERERLLEFNEVVLKACDGDVRQRYSSAQQLESDLALLHRGQSVQRKRAVERRWEALTKFSVVAGLIALVVVGGVLLRQAVQRGKPADSGEWRQIEMKGTQNREAWNAYITGLHYYQRETAEGTKRAVEHLKEAMRLDPKFAQPYAAFAELCRWNDYLFPSRQEALRQGKEAALQALALNNSLAQAHKEVGLFATYFDRDWPKAVKELKRALELSPDYATGHATYAWFLLQMRRFEEAKREIRLTLKLAPENPRAWCTASSIFRAAGEQDEAVAQLHKALDLNPNYWLAFERLGVIYEERGEFPEAIEMFRKAAIAREVEPEKAAQRSIDLAQAFSTAGARGYWQKKLELTHAGDLYDIALIHLQLGETNSMFECLEKAEALKTWDALDINFDQRFDSVRSDPRFQALLRKLGLEK